MMNSYEALNDILATAGTGPAQDDQVRITGDDPVLPTNFLIGTAGAAVISATGLAASNLWELRTGRSQAVSIDVRRAAMAMRSDRFLYRDGKKAHGADPVSGIYQGRDGRWVQLHCNYPHHRDRTVALLGAEQTKASVAAAVAKWDIPDLENAITEAASIAGMVRSPEDWAAHPQSAAVAALPLFEIIRMARTSCGSADPTWPSTRPW